MSKKTWKIRIYCSITCSKIGRKHTQETKDKIRKALLESKRKEETKRKMSEARILFYRNGGINPMKGKITPDDVRKKLSEANRGEKSWNWKGGITPINKAIRSSWEYRKWKRIVFERDNYACISCGCDEKSNLQIDHIKPFSLFPELRFTIDNGRTLCIKCHGKLGWNVRRKKTIYI